jgi:hypothetical protein|nr:MAG TPA: FeoB-associated Cys-rich membrane protein [Caudoviricetes sp.]
MPPANIIIYISLSGLLLFMVFKKRKTIKKYKKLTFLGQVWGEALFVVVSLHLIHPYRV